jgi:hypothetical protein
VKEVDHSDSHFHEESCEKVTFVTSKRLAKSQSSSSVSKLTPSLQNELSDLAQA